MKKISFFTFFIKPTYLNNMIKMQVIFSGMLKNENCLL